MIDDVDCDSEYISLVYADSKDNLCWIVGDHGFDPWSVEYRKVKMGGITLKVTRVLEHEGDHKYFEPQFEFDHFSEYMMEYMEKSKDGWKPLMGVGDEFYS